MAAQPAYANVPKAAVTAISTANTNRDGTGTLGTVFTAGTSGSRIDRIVVQATGTTTAGMVRLFLHNGTTAFLYDEVPVSATTPSATVQAFAATLEAFSAPRLMPLVLQTGWSLRASTHNAESFNIVAVGGDL
jgi:hypothetical protein